MRKISMSMFALGLAVLATAAPPAGTPQMASYQFGLLRKGPTWTAQRTPASDSIQAGHLANIGRMWEEGALLGAGPLVDGGTIRGVFIFRSDSVSRLRALAARDPAIQSKRLVLDLYPWFAPAGIGKPYAERAKRPGHRDSMITLQLGLLKRGPKWLGSSPTPEAMALQKAHLHHLFAMHGDGRLAAVGPLLGDTLLAGILVFRADSATAHRLALEVPAVKAQDLTVEMHPWMVAYGTMPGDTL